MTALVQSSASVGQLLLYLLQVIAVFLASTVVFDTIHFLLHRFAASPIALLRAIGGLHEWHHRFADRELRIHEEYVPQNLRWHVIPEFLTQIFCSVCLLFVLPAPVVLGAMAIQVLVFALIFRARGIDINHKPIERLRAYHPSIVCLPEYHALHHAHPDAHFSSWIKLLDQVVGTGTSLRGRTVALVGGTSPFGAAVRALLERAGVAKVVELESTANETARAQLAEQLVDIDILVLADPEPFDACAERVAWIERFKEAAAGRKLPPEVWALARERDATSPLSPDSTEEAAFARHARHYYSSGRVIYRHIVVPEKAAPGAPDPTTSARRALFWIRRGFHYVPTRRSVRALLDFLRFRFAVRGLPPEPAQ